MLAVQGGGTNPQGAPRPPALSNATAAPASQQCPCSWSRPRPSASPCTGWCAAGLAAGLADSTLPSSQRLGGCLQRCAGPLAPTSSQAPLQPLPIRQVGYAAAASNFFIFVAAFCLFCITSEVRAAPAAGSARRAAHAAVGRRRRGPRALRRADSLASPCSLTVAPPSAKCMRRPSARCAASPRAPPPMPPSCCPWSCWCCCPLRDTWCPTCRCAPPPPPGCLDTWLPPAGWALVRTLRQRQQLLAGAPSAACACRPSCMQLARVRRPTALPLCAHPTCAGVLQVAADHLVCAVHLLSRCGGSQGAVRSRALPWPVPARASPPPRQAGNHRSAHGRVLTAAAAILPSGRSDDE